MRYDWAKYSLSITTPTDSVGIQVYDVINIDWSKFAFSTTYTTHTVTSMEVLKPWLISYKYFQSYTYEDIIFWINGIRNPLELSVGIVLRIPARTDIQNFLAKIKT